jgi:hypothetical protein
MEAAAVLGMQNTAEWHVDVRRLSKKFTRMSKPLRLTIPGQGSDSMDFILSIHAKGNSNARGGSSSKAARGVCILKVKSNQPASKLCMTVGGDIEAQTLVHDFASCEVATFPGEWSFQQAAKGKSYVVLTLQAELPSTQLPVDTQQQSATELASSCAAAAVASPTAANPLATLCSGYVKQNLNSTVAIPATPNVNGKSCSTCPSYCIEAASCIQQVQRDINTSQNDVNKFLDAKYEMESAAIQPPPALAQSANTAEVAPSNVHERCMGGAKAGASQRTVVLSLDYDGCADVLFECVYLCLSRRNMTAGLKKLKEVRAHLLSILEGITAGASRVILMVGSNRQSIRVDQYNRMIQEKQIGKFESEIGLVRTDFSKLASSMGWELNKALLADKVNGVPAGTAWDNGHVDFVFEKGMDMPIKKAILEFQFEELSQLKDLEGPVDFYFFDDRSKYLDYVREQLVMDKKIADSVSFYTVHFDWFSHIVEHAALELQAVDTLGQSRSLNAIN